MAVFTKLTKKEIDQFIQNYEIGKLKSYEEIIEWIENSNYKIITNQTSFIPMLVVNTSIHYPVDI